RAARPCDQREGRDSRVVSLRGTAAGTLPPPRSRGTLRARSGRTRREGEMDQHSDHGVNSASDGIPVGDLVEEPTPKRRHRATAVLAIVVVCVIVAAAIAVIATRGSSGKSAIAVLDDASTRTTGSGTAHVSMTESASADGQTLEPLSLTGDEDYAHHAGEFS